MVGTSNKASSNKNSASDTLNSAQHTRRDKKSNAATGASAAGVRAIASQTLAFYFRAPAKAFFRTRVE